MTEAKSDKSARTLPWLDNIAYSMGNLGSNLVFGMAMFYMTYFYTDIMLIPAAATGVLFLVARFWDAINDPIMGMLVDRTHTRLGKFRPFIIIGIFPCAIMYVLTFHAPDYNTNGKIIWAYCTYIPLGMMSTFINIPYHAQTTIMTTDPIERAEVGTVSNMTALIGQLIVAAGTLPLVAMFADQKAGFTRTAMIFGAAMLVCYTITFIRTKKYDLPASKQKLEKTAANNYSFKEKFRVLTQNRPLLALMTGYFFFQLSMSMLAALPIYFFKYYLVKESLYPAAMGLFLLLMVAGMLIVPVLSRKIGKKMLFQASNLISLAAWGGLYFVFHYSGRDIMGSPLLWPALALGALSTFFNGPVVALVWGMIPDTVEYAELKVGIRSEGLIFALLSFVMKSGLAVGGAIAAGGLSIINYIPGKEQTPETLHSMLVLIFLVPLIFRFLTWVGMHFYNLTEERFREIVEELKLIEESESMPGII